MCSPIGHSIAALTLGIRRESRPDSFSLSYWVLILFSGSVADLDFLIGWVKGDINGYHHLGSHSLVAILAYSLLVYFLVCLMGKTSKESKQWSLCAGLIYGSHLLLDYLATDNSDPIGLQLFWPFSEQFYASPLFLFPPFRHDTVGSDMMLMVVGVFSWQNLATVLIELLILLPIAVIWISRKSKQT